MNRIEKRFNELKKKNEKAFITYMTAGLPDMKKCGEIIKAQDEAGIDVIELGIKPTDFLTFNHHYPSDWNNGDIINRRRILNEVNLNSHEILSAYLLWYPLIAACSFIRKNKNDPFASEYIFKK